MRNPECVEVSRRLNVQISNACRVSPGDPLTIASPLPLFFVRAESKGPSSAASLLFATLAGRFISVAAKGLMGADCWRKSNWVGPDDFGGVRRTVRREAIKGEAPSMAGASAT